MNRCLAVAQLSVLTIALAAGCENRVVQPQPKPAAAPKKSPYEFLRAKTEHDGNVMELYAFSGKFNQSRLVEFCRERKSKSSAKVFYYVVIVDDAANAAFPNSPFTAQFGGEESKLRHIRAIYEFNRLNGFSELTYYDTNMWEGKATRVKL